MGRLSCESQNSIPVSFVFPTITIFSPLVCLYLPVINRLTTSLISTKASVLQVQFRKIKMHFIIFIFFAFPYQIIFCFLDGEDTCYHLAFSCTSDKYVQKMIIFIFLNLINCNYSHMYQAFCVCVKRKTLCNCLCSSSSSSLPALSGILENSEQKIILQTIKQLIQLHGFRDSVPVLKIHGCY